MSDNPHGMKLWRHWFNMETPEGREYRIALLGTYSDQLYYDVGYSNLIQYYGPFRFRSYPIETVISKTEQIDQEEWRIYARNLMRGVWEEPDWTAEPIEEHFAHIKREENGAVLIRFIQSEAHGKRGRLTLMKPGKYLTRYYPDYSADEVRAMVADLDKALEVNFAVTAEEIEDVYTNGPESCMSYTASQFQGKVHPVHVYGDSDLQLAYLKKRSSDRVTARCLVWPAQKRYYRAYGDELRLVPALEKLGYTQGNLRGAKVNLIWHREGQSVIMPYVDGISEADMDGDKIVLGSGSIMCQTTNGVADCQSGTYCSYTEEHHDEDEMIFCDDTEEYYHQSALENGFLWQDSLTGNIYRSEYYRVTTEDGEDYHRHTFERLGGYYCNGNDSYHVTRTRFYGDDENPPVVLKDTEETVSLDYAEAHCVEIDGDWYAEAPESPEEVPAPVEAMEVAEITEMAA